MPTIIKTISFILFISVLSACSSTMKSTSDNTNTMEDKKINTAKINSQLGIAYLENHEVQQAKQKLLLALKEAPNIPEPWYSMGYFLEATGSKEEARADYLKAVEIAPYRGDVQNNYGTFLCRSGDYQLAIQHFLVAIKDTNYLDTAAAYENAGLCALKIPDKKQAIQYFNLALEQDPNRSLSEMELKKLKG